MLSLTNINKFTYIINFQVAVNSMTMYIYELARPDESLLRVYDRLIQRLVDLCTKRHVFTKHCESAPVACCNVTQRKHTSSITTT